MRHAKQSTIFLLITALLLSGCATSGKSSSQQHDQEPKPKESSPTRLIPPPPAPAAYGISHVKTIGFLRVFGNTDNADDRECCTTPSTEGCSAAHKPGLFSCLRGKNIPKLFGRCKTDDTVYSSIKQSCLMSLPAWWFNDSSLSTGCCTSDVCVDDACGEKPVCQLECNNGCATFKLECGGCENDRHPCLAERLEDPFLDQLQEQEIQSEQPQVPPSPAATPVVPTPQAQFPLPYTGVSSGNPADSYFPMESSRQRSIVEPPRWQGRRTTRSTAAYHSVTQETTALTESTPTLGASLQIMIQPHQHFGR